MRVFVLFILHLSFLAFIKAHGATEAAAGYISDVQAERAERFYEVYLFIPTNRRDPTLQEMIFSPLTKEFKEKYREKFGQLDTESITYRSQALGGVNQTPQVLEEENQKRKAFAEYMTKRLIEHHVDNYMRTQPQMQPVLEVKEKIQNVKVEVNKEVRLNIQYNFAGNVADVLIDNPYCESKISLEMDPRSFGPTEVSETRVWLAKDLNSYLRANSNVAVNDGIAYADLTRAFAKYHFSTSVGVSSAFKDGGTSVRETKYLVGFSHSY